VREAEALLHRHDIPYIDTTSMSVEEISASILQRTGLESRVGR
jgi:regulator of PEP synthase PpsR (kinase-PPPase family)